MRDDDSSRALRHALRTPAAVADDEGAVVVAGGDFVTVSGLRAAAAGDVIAVGERRAMGLVAELRADHAVVALLDRGGSVGEGARARRVGALTVPVDDVLGRVLDPLGRPLDGRCAPGGARAASRGAVRRRWAPSPTPGVFTGLPIVDLAAPLLEGVSQALLGPEGSGRSTTVDDFAAACVRAGMRCVLVLLPRDGGELARRVEALRRRGVLGGCAVIAATPGDPPARIALAPRVGAMLARAWFEGGARAVLFCDDLTPWAEAVTSCAEALGRPRGPDGAPLSLMSELAAVTECATARAEPPEFTVSASCTVVAVGGEHGALAGALGSMAELVWRTDASLRARALHPAIDPSRGTIASTAVNPGGRFLRQREDARLAATLRHWRRLGDASTRAPAEVIEALGALSVNPGEAFDPVESFILRRLILARSGEGALDAAALRARVVALRPEIAPLLEGSDRGVWEDARRAIAVAAARPLAPEPARAELPSRQGPYRG